jgi:hypothetical protein
VSLSLVKQENGGEMSKSLKKRASGSNIEISSYVKCQRIYPVEDKKSRNIHIQDLKTVGIKLSSEQAIKLALVLLAASQEWKEIDLTAWRKPLSSGEYKVTVTGMVEVESRDE